MSYLFNIYLALVLLIGHMTFTENVYHTYMKTSIMVKFHLCTLFVLADLYLTRYSILMLNLAPSLYKTYTEKLERHISGKKTFKSLRTHFRKG